jgi:5-formyltetrahydrofolate cyclo-ligase
MTPSQRTAADAAIANHVLKLGAFRSARRVAVFLAFDGEPSLKRVAEAAARIGKRVYVPTITRTRMRFVELRPRASLGANVFGILEPEVFAPIDPRRLDLVLTPLVAFDDRGVRIGVGRGYYDRCFHFLLARSMWRRPKLLGVAYELQHVAEIQPEPWDVPLWGAVSEAGFRRFEGA